MDLAQYLITEKSGPKTSMSALSAARIEAQQVLKMLDVIIAGRRKKANNSDKSKKKMTRRRKRQYKTSK